MESLLKKLKWFRDECEAHGGNEFVEVYDYAVQLEAELAKEIESRDGWCDAWKKSDAENERLKQAELVGRAGLIAEELFEAIRRIQEVDEFDMTPKPSEVSE